MQDKLNKARKHSAYLQLFLVVGVLIATLWSAIYFDLVRARDEAFSKGNGDLTNLALAFSKEIESSVKTIDVTLLDLRTAWLRDPKAFWSAVRQRQSYLERELAFQVGVIDAQGMLAFSSLEQQARPIDLSDREHFRAHRMRSTDELFISRPVLGRVSKRWSIQFTRAIYDKGDNFVGVMVLSVSPDYLYRFHRSINLMQDSAITLVRDSGEILARYPAPERALGKSLSGSPFLDPIAPEIGSFRKVSEVDGIERLYAWRKVAPYDLVVVIGHSTWVMSAPYRDQKSRSLVYGAGVSLLLLLAGYLKLIGIKQQRKAAQRLAANEERWRLALEAAGDGVWDWDVVNSQVVYSNGWKSMLGYRPDEIGGDLEEWKKRVHPDDMAAVMHDVVEHFDGRTNFYRNEHRVRCKDGSWKWILDRGMVIQRDDEGKPLRMVGTHTDISSRKEMEEILKTLASTDALTGLSNRRQFMERLDNEISRIKRYPASEAALLMADLDHFKKINDTWGHAAGDAVLKHFSSLIRGTVRNSDYVGRLGGEEFGVLLTETDLRDAEQFAERLCAALRASPFQFGEDSIHLTVSIGIAMLAPIDTSPEHTLQRADVALYQAKNSGRDRFISKAA